MEEALSVPQKHKCHGKMTYRNLEASKMRTWHRPLKISWTDTTSMHKSMAQKESLQEKNRIRQRSRVQTSATMTLPHT